MAVGLLVGVLPAIANVGEVWEAIQTLTWLESGSLLALAAWNIFTYQLVIMSALPGLTLGRAFVVGQISTAVTNTLPAGSAVGVGITYSMFSSFGFESGSIAIAAVVTGLWNTFVKLGLPIVAFAILSFQGKGNAALQSAAITGLIILLAAIGVLVLALARESVAYQTGDRLGRIATSVGRRFRRGPYDGWGDRLVTFREQSIDLLRRRWHWISLSTIVSHLSLYALLVLSLRHMGISAIDVTGAEALAVFALVRLVAAVPITPGGLGVVEVGYTTALVVAGGDEELVVAAVLIYRALSYLLQVPLGAIAFVVWRSRGDWRVGE
ncbi:MAG: flippase-like domain-containing protein [Acidimicrobiia bacterium]|nr:flippase-like domain-containing protein [Acidimicrobiia bacterium]MBT8218121.1 flippase-like domain-containing protein [Acidimicrobiia bacterium]NNF10541.1 flippase-like domain-containing protein [Acidimicrobiia bacterium]NNL69760.1 flippase-like domain-containing protein [Acidimicrobiia bacterium]